MTEAQFKALPRSEKAVLVAKDIIKQLKAGKYDPNTGRYINATPFNVYGNNTSVKKILCSKDAPVCTVCARGALVLSTIRFVNNMDVVELLDLTFSLGYDARRSDSAVRLVQEVFSKKQQGLIESAFERNDRYAIGVGNTFQSAQKAVDFGRVSYDEYWARYKSLKKTFLGAVDYRMYKIFKNIIDNNGTFKP
jgi:hypothetical protein